MVLGIDPDLVIPDKRLSVYEGAIAPWQGEKLGLVERKFDTKLQRNLIFLFINQSSILPTAQYDLLWTGKNILTALMIFLKR